MIGSVLTATVIKRVELTAENRAGIVGDWQSVVSDEAGGYRRMIVRLGQRYRLVYDLGLPDVVATVHDGGTSLVAKTDAGRSHFVTSEGVMPGVGRLVEIETAKLPPVFRHDDDEHRRLQRLFRGERDVTLGTGH